MYTFMKIVAWYSFEILLFHNTFTLYLDFKKNRINEKEFMII